MTIESMRSRGSSGAARTAASIAVAELGGGVGEHGIDQLVLGGEPVQHRLLADPDDGSDLVERHGVDAACPEQLDGRLEDPRPSVRHALIAFPGHAGRWTLLGWRLVARNGSAGASSLAPVVHPRLSTIW